MDKLVSIGYAANLLGVTIQTIRNWDKQGLLKP
ncbi:TPA: MerR family DNA-binding transcriptional regulator, partial [Campylobacter jejuni]|nr:MerR family DNA-binding transcriptional regulator [Campylobacter jejuni]HEB9277901.1 MerR family DNA-binding transcriptional regulator [Campylobacter jejuni]